MDGQARAREGPGGGSEASAHHDACLSYGLLFVLGASVVWISLALPGDAEREPGPLAASAALVFALGLLLLTRRGNLAPWILQTSVMVVLGLVGLAATFAGPAAAGLSLVAFTLIVLPGFYYFEIAAGLGFAVCAGGVYAAVLAFEEQIPLRGLQLLIGLAGIAAAALIMVRLRSETDALLARLDRTARTDPLTGLANRREFNDRFALELARAERTEEGLALVVLDLDGFKQVNDAHGHEAGDRALRSFGILLSEWTRRVDLVARLGGEEFGIIAPDTGPPAAMALAERIRVATAATLHGSGPITTSCGVATLPESGAGADALLRAADTALYAAKHAGRNRTVLYRAGLDS